MGLEVVKEVDFNKMNIVTQANSLVEARYTISKNEQLILLAMLSFIDPDDKEFLTYRTSITQFSDLIGLDSKNRIKEVKIITARLLSRVVTINTPSGWKMHQWVSYAEADYKEDSLLLKFHDHLKPYLLELKQRFTSFKLSEVIELKSVYAIRIYQLLKDYDGQKRSTFSYSVSDFRDIVLGERSKKYSVFNNFRMRIIERAKEELDEKSNFSFSYKTVKVGRSIGKIEFTIIKKSKSIPAVALPQESNEKTKEMLSIGISEKNALEFLKHYGAEYITEKLQVLAEAQQLKEIKSSSGYFIKALKEDWKSEKLQEKAKSEEKRRLQQEKQQKERLHDETLNLEKSFRIQEKKRFLATLSALETADFLEQAKRDNVDLADMMDSLNSPFCGAFVIAQIPKYKENLASFIQQGLMKQGLLPAEKTAN